MLDGLATDIGGMAIQADLSTPDGPAEAVDKAVAALGGLDLLLVNSGGPPGQVRRHHGRAMAEGHRRHTVVDRPPDPRRVAAPEVERQSSILIILSSSVREPIAALTTSTCFARVWRGCSSRLSRRSRRYASTASHPVASPPIASRPRRWPCSTPGMTVEEVQQQTIARIPLGRYGKPEEVGRVGAFPALARGQLRHRQHRRRRRRHGRSLPEVPMSRDEIRTKLQAAIDYLNANPAEARYRFGRDGARGRLGRAEGRGRRSGRCPDHHGHADSVGGGNTNVSPGWYLRAAEASCAWPR